MKEKEKERSARVKEDPSELAWLCRRQPSTVQSLCMIAPYLVTKHFPKQNKIYLSVVITAAKWSLQAQVLTLCKSLKVYSAERTHTSHKLASHKS